MAKEHNHSYSSAIIGHPTGTVLHLGAFHERGNV